MRLVSTFLYTRQITTSTNISSMCIRIFINYRLFHIWTVIRRGIVGSYSIIPCCILTKGITLSSWVINVSVARMRAVMSMMSIVFISISVSCMKWIVVIIGGINHILNTMDLECLNIIKFVFTYYYYYYLYHCFKTVQLEHTALYYYQRYINYYITVSPSSLAFVTDYWTIDIEILPYIYICLFVSYKLYIPFILWILELKKSK